MKNPRLGDLKGFGYGPNLGPYWPPCFSFKELSTVALQYSSCTKYLLRIGEIVILVSRTSDFNPEVERKFFFLSPKKASKSCTVEISIFDLIILNFPYWKF
jgi:hypothetical protein